VLWAALAPRVAEVVRESPPDVALVEHDGAAGWALALAPAIPAVLAFTDVSWHYYERRARMARGVRRALLAREAGRFRDWDARHVARYAALVTVSERDRVDVLSLAPDQRVAVVANGVATDQFRPRPHADGPPTVLFTGTMNHPPNAEGIRWFTERAWPRVRQAIPDARLLVVGRDPPDGVRRLAERPGVEVLGAVPSMQPYFARATAIVVPIRSGGGTRLKVLEAMASGRAVASTSMGVEGIELERDVHVLVEDDPIALSIALVRLLSEPDLRSRLASAGRTLVEERYDWRALGDRLEALLRAVADQRAA
jgi:polysaccharide biosynthesis protein PslH